MPSGKAPRKNKRQGWRVAYECRSDYRTSNELVSPAISGASNFKSRFRDYRGGNEAEEEKQLEGKHGSAAAGERFRSNLLL